MRLWYYLFRGAGVAYGPVKAENEKAARKEIRRVWQLNNTRWVEVWETSQESIDAISRQREEMAREMKALNVCAPDL